jgi:hypothetical protein
MKFLILMLCTLFAVQNADAANNDIASTLRAMSKKINLSLPVPVDTEKILETTVAIDRTLIFKYKVNDNSSFKDPRFHADRYTYYIRKSLARSTCKDALPLFERGASYNYIFIDKYGQNLFEYTLDKKECVELSDGSD